VLRVVRVLIVCTGNIARSPIAVESLRRRLKEAPVVLTSAGTRVYGPRSVTSEARRVIEGLGGSADEHRSRPLLTQSVVRSHLVLTATREHRRAVLDLVPSKVRATFTLREFRRLSDGVSDEALRTAVESAGPEQPERLTAALLALGRARPHTVPADPLDDDVEDPLGRGDAAYDRVAAQMDGAAASVARVLLQVTGDRSP
jgi:protein-tyrosine phosphatase